MKTIQLSSSWSSSSSSSFVTKLSIVVASYFILVRFVFIRGDNEEDDRRRIVDYPTLNASACLRRPDKVLTMTCDPGQMVRLVRIYFGNSERGLCQYSSGDCFMDLPPAENYACVGMDRCQVNLPSGNVGRTIPKCGKLSTYIEALYQCIPESDSLDICDRAAHTGQRGYLRTPRYPHNYPTRLNCSFTLQAPFQEQRIRLFVVDLNLEANGTACNDWIQVFDGFQSTTLCGQRARYWLLDSRHRSLHVHFYSDDGNREKGFWLYYEAFPLIANARTSVTFTPATAFLTPTKRVATVQRVSSAAAAASVMTRPARPDLFPLPSSTSSQVAVASNQVDRNAQQLPLGVLMAIIISLLICILIVLLVVVFIKSRSRRRSNPMIHDCLPDDNEPMNNTERAERVRRAASAYVTHGSSTKEPLTSHSTSIHLDSQKTI